MKQGIIVNEESYNTGHTHTLSDPRSLFASPNIQYINPVERQSTALELHEADIESELDELLEMLPKVINAKFQVRTGDSDPLFYMPEGYETYSVSQKIALARDLSDLTLQSINQSIYSTVPNYAAHVGNLALIEKLMKADSRMELSNEELQGIVTLLLDTKSHTDTELHKQTFMKLQDKVIEQSLTLADVNEKNRKAEEHFSFLNYTNIKLKSNFYTDSLKIMKQQETSLEKQLEDALIEVELAKNNFATLAEELEEANTQIRYLYSASPNHSPYREDEDKPLFEVCRDPNDPDSDSEDENPFKVSEEVN
jgi:hypothetical protein